MNRRDLAEQGIDVADVDLLLKAVRRRFLAPDKEESDCAIITAIEGLKWLTGDEDAVVDRAWLEQYLEVTENRTLDMRKTVS